MHSSGSEGGRLETFCCYVYGSVHIKYPPLDKIGKIVDQVDYVLLEGVKMNKKGTLFVLVFPLLITFLVYKGIIRLITLLNKNMRGKADMEVLKRFFEERGKPVEIADYELYDLIKKKPKLTVSISSLQLICSLFLLYSILLIFLENKLNLFLLLHNIAKLFLLNMLAFSFFVSKTKNTRDELLIKRVTELRNRGYKCVFIARGKDHIKFIKAELEKIGVLVVDIVSKK
ncbi:MAG: hypothetical protein QXI90_06430 [Thermofilum sp.]